MAASAQSSRRIPGYCALCVSRCGSIATVENGRFVELEPDPSHPTGQALCAKGRAAPELVYHPDRLLHPLKRTRPKGDPDPGWQRIGWDEALDLTAAGLRKIAAESGPESVAFSIVSPSTSSISDSLIWIDRLTRAFGTPNRCTAMELCGYGRFAATSYTYGASVPGHYMPDLEHAGCILFWGYNPNLARIAHAVATTAALKRGARLIVVDPRRAGPAAKADLWLQVRPGTDCALALGVAHVLIERGWYDLEFVRDWTNGPLLVRGDNGRLLTEGDLTGAGATAGYLAWNGTRGCLVRYDPATGAYEGKSSELALSGQFAIETLHGKVPCRPAFGVMAEACGQYPPERVQAICGIDPGQTERAAQMLWESRPVAYYAWSGVEMQTNATQIARAIAQLYALTGSFDARGGNVLFAAAPSGNVGGEELLSADQRARALGLRDRPLGPARWQHVTSEELYRAILQRQPYAVRGLVGFGANLLLSHADGRRGRQALAALDFYVHADLFMNPTAELADIVLPSASAFECEALRIGFEGSTEAQSLVQLRPPVAERRGEARSDTEIVFDLACRLGLGSHFWDGDIEAGYRYQLQPSGVSLDTLRENRGGVRVPLQTRYRKFAERKDGVPQGFATPTRKVELYSETLLEHGYPPVPVYEEPLVGPSARPDLLERFPLVLTCAKHILFCESQHRALPSLRRRALDPEVEIHPEAATARGIGPGDWVHIETPVGSIRARARINDALRPNVVCGQHGWWQACPDIGAPGHDPFGPDGANLNLIIGNEAIDPVSGSVPHRAYLCQIRRARAAS
ncbi:MAG TPA: molybdopterin-dependent oxidoreductase [Anaeromyxobacteraceae bacterium]|nr:molybdopterin-dependent oxidoreductase [Anaeromyxobacteraceae bacterium]